ncbi:MAG: hypothetical protein WAK17_20310 [Candidatus Nitrosopolaris sp.]
MSLVLLNFNVPQLKVQRSQRRRDAIFDFFDDKRNDLDDTLVFYYSGHGIPDAVCCTIILWEDVLLKQYPQLSLFLVILQWELPLIAVTLSYYQWSSRPGHKRI